MNEVFKKKKNIATQKKKDLYFMFKAIKYYNFYVLINIQTIKCVKKKINDRE